MAPMRNSWRYPMGFINVWWSNNRNPIAFLPIREIFKLINSVKSIKKLKKKKV
jgi:hypothetical protein